MDVDIVLVNPPYLTKEVYGNLYKAAGIFPPLGLAYVAANLEKHGYSVKIIDNEDSWDETFKDIKSCRPKILGVTCTSPLLKDVIKIASFAKKLGSKVVVGGIHATSSPEEMAKHEEFDVISFGEAEHTILEIVQALYGEKDLKDVKGISFREEGKIIKTKNRSLQENINKLPFPAYHLLDMEKYRFYSLFDRTKNFFTMITIRGCPFTCVFCNTRTMFDRKVRLRSPRNVFEDVKLLNKKYSIKEIYFYDDTFTLNRDRTLALCDLLEKSDLQLLWSTETRSDKVDHFLLNKMKQAGCYMIGYGFESADQDILNKLKKGTTVEKNIEAVKLTHQAGMLVRAFLLIGAPGETKSTIQKTVNFSLMKGITYAHFNIVTPYPDTLLWHKAVNEGMLDPEEVSGMGAIANVKAYKKLVGTDLDADKVKKEWIKANIRFYVRPYWIYTMIKNIRGWYHFKNVLKALLGFLQGLIQK